MGIINLRKHLGFECTEQSRLLERWNETETIEDGDKYRRHLRTCKTCIDYDEAKYMWALENIPREA